MSGVGSVPGWGRGGGSEPGRVRARACQHSRPGRPPGPRAPLRRASCPPAAAGPRVCPQLDCCSEEELVLGRLSGNRTVSVEPLRTHIRLGTVPVQTGCMLACTHMHNACTHASSYTCTHMHAHALARTHKQALCIFSSLSFPVTSSFPVSKTTQPHRTQADKHGANADRPGHRRVVDWKCPSPGCPKTRACTPTSCTKLSMDKCAEKPGTGSVPVWPPSSGILGHA